MSNYTSIILFISGLENESERIKEVNSFQISHTRSLNFVDLNNYEKFADIFPRFLYSSTYNYFNLTDFFLHLQNNVKWDHPEYVQLFIKEEADLTCRVYLHAGKIQIHNGNMI